MRPAIALSSLCVRTAL